MVTMPDSGDQVWRDSPVSKHLFFILDIF